MMLSSLRRAELNGAEEIRGASRSNPSYTIDCNFANNPNSAARPWNEAFGLGAVKPQHPPPFGRTVRRNSRLRDGQ
jgi:hypothetical protein